MYLAAADRGECVAAAGEDESEKVVDFCGGCDGRTGILDVDFLLDGDCRGDAVDEVDIRFAHAAKELAGIGGYTLREASLTLCIKGIERQAGLAAAGNAGHNHELTARYFQVDVLKIIDPRSLYDYRVAQSIQK